RGDRRDRLYARHSLCARTRLSGRDRARAARHSTLFLDPRATTHDRERRGGRGAALLPRCREPRAGARAPRSDNRAQLLARTSPRRRAAAADPRLHRLARCPGARRARRAGPVVTLAITAPTFRSQPSLAPAAG